VVRRLLLLILACALVAVIVYPALTRPADTAPTRPTALQERLQAVAKRHGGLVK
jgi:hypothetical protein